MIVACVPAMAAAQSNKAAPFHIPFHVPTDLGTAHLQDSEFVGDAMAYKYQGQRMVGLDIYVWPLPAQGADSQQRDGLLQTEVTKFKEVVPQGVQRGWYEDYRIAFTAPHPVPLDGDSLPGYAVALAFSRGGQRYASFFYIYAVQGMFLKIRLTVPAENWGSNPAMDLPAEVVRAVAQKR